MDPIRWTEKRKTQLIFVIDLAEHALCEDGECEDEFRKDVLDFQKFMEKKGLYPTKEN